MRADFVRPVSGAFPAPLLLSLNALVDLVLAVSYRADDVLTMVSILPEFDSIGDALDNRWPAAAGAGCYETGARIRDDRRSARKHQDADGQDNEFVPSNHRSQLFHQLPPFAERRAETRHLI